MKKLSILGLALGLLIAATLACGPLPTTEPTPTLVPATQVPPTQVPPTQVPPTQVPPTSIPLATADSGGGKTSAGTTPTPGGGKTGAMPTATPDSGAQVGSSKGDSRKDDSRSSSGTALELVNQSGAEVCWVYISPTSSDQWGDDWLGDTEVIAHGARRSFDVAAGTYDLQALDCDDNVIDERYSISIAGDLQWTLSEEVSSDVVLTLYNDSGVEVCYLYVSPSASDEWGSDWLGNGTIADGQQWSARVPIGTYDLLAEDCSENTVDEQYQVVLSSDADWRLPQVAGGTDSSLTIVNDTDTPIWYVNISPTSADEWGADWLGNDQISAHSSHTFYLSEGSYDLRAEDDSYNVMATRFDEYISGDVEWLIQPGAGVNLTLYNNSGQEVCYVYISPSSSSDWGDDWLGESETVDSGNSRTFNLPTDTYDVYAEDCDGNTLDEQYDVSVTSNIDWNIVRTGGQSASITLYNNSGQDVCYVYISPSSSSDWGDDWLGESETVDSGYARTFSLPAGTYDMYAEDCDSNTLDEQYDVDVSGSIDWDLGQVGSQSASVTLRNDSSSAVCYVLISPSSSSSWGDDWLGEDETIDPGYERAFYMAKGTYDFQALDCAENVLSELFDIDISRDKIWTVD